MMNLVPSEITIREIIKNYKDDSINQGAVIGYDGKLNIRPAYQRNYVYDDKKRNAVIDTILKGFPLNVMYWNDNGDDTYEVIDGQQRLISICRFCCESDTNHFSINLNGKNDWRKFESLSVPMREKILDYKCHVYICKGGTADEKLDWFEVININSEPLKTQELRNAQFTGKWLTDAKFYFSRTKGNAEQIAKEYMTGSANRQEYLETALEWIVDSQKLRSINEYMSNHVNDEDAQELWTYFNQVINWVKLYFPNYRNMMKGIDWGILYNQYKDNKYNPIELENDIKELILDKEVGNQKGIYEYLLSGKDKSKERKLSLREFDENEKMQLFEMQNHKCAKCGEKFRIDQLDAHHKTLWSEGGKTTLENGVLYCKTCHHIEHDNVK